MAKLGVTDSAAEAAEYLDALLGADHGRVHGRAAGGLRPHAPASWPAG